MQTQESMISNKIPCADPDSYCCLLHFSLVPYSTTLTKTTSKVPPLICNNDIFMGEKFKMSKLLNFRNSNLKTCSIPTKYSLFKSLNGQLTLDRLYINKKTY